MKTIKAAKCVQLAARFDRVHIVDRPRGMKRCGGKDLYCPFVEANKTRGGGNAILDGENHSYCA